MKNNSFLIKTKETSHELIPNYYDYGIAIDRVKDMINQQLQMDLHMYESDDFLDFDFVLKYLITNHSAEMEILGSVFDSVSTRKISYNDNKKYEVTHSLANNLFYFPKYHVVVVKIPIFQNHMEYEREFYFAPDDTTMLHFSQFMVDKEHEMMLDGINIFMDTEEGLVRSQEKISQQISRENILLDEAVKTNIYRTIDEFFVNGGKFFQQYDIPYRRGILLYGSPGNGKTTLVKSIAGSVSAPIVYWQITEYTSSYSITEVFEKVTKLAPMILIIEDIDSMPDEARSTFLNTLDGATTKEGVFLIGTTNYPEKIDPALINRAGRFDRAYEIKQPTESLRAAYLEKKGILQFIEDMILQTVAEKTQGLSIAQLNEFYMSVALQAYYKEEINVEQIIEDLLENQRKTKKQAWEVEDDFETMGFK